MAVSAGTAYLDVAPRLQRNFSRDLTRDMLRPMSRSAERSGRDAGRRYGTRFSTGLRTGLGPVTGIARVAGGALAAAFGGAIVAKGLKSTIDAASDLNETLSKSRIIFGRSSRDIEKWARNSARDFGLSRNEAIGAAASFGDMFLQLKLGRPQAVNMSKGMVQLATDMASFHNADITQVLEAQSAAFRGEYDSLQRFIPGITAARVEQEALRMTHKKSAKDLTAAEKAQAVYNIMLTDGKRAAGDFARTSKGAANQQRILRARVKDLQASIGRGLLPAYAAVLAVINDKLLPAMGRFAKTAIPALRTALGGVGDQAKGLFDALKLDIDLTTIKATAKGWTAAVIGGFKLGLKSGDWSGFSGVFGNVLAKIIGNGVELFKRALAGVDWPAVGKTLGGGLVSMATTIAPMFRDVLGRLVDQVDWRGAGQQAVKAALPFVLGFVGGIVDALITAFRKDFWGTVLDVLTIIPIGRAAGVLAKVFGKLPILGSLLRAISSVGKGLEKPIFGVVGAIGRFFIRAFQRAFPEVSGRFGRWLVSLIFGIDRLYGRIKAAGARFVGGLLDGIEGQAGLVIRNVRDLIGWLVKPFVRAGVWLVKRGGQVVVGLIRGVEAVGRGLGRVALRVIGWLTTPFRPAARWLVARGQQAVGGLIRGITSMYARAQGAASGLVRAIGRVMGRVVGAVAAPFRTARTLINRFLGGIESIGTKIGLSKGWLSFRIPAFQHGGIVGMKQGGGVPGTGRGDKVRALLEPGEVVIPNRAEDRRRLLRDPKVRRRLGDVGGDPSELVIRMQKGGMAPRLTGLVGRVQDFMRSTDPLPYRWGAAGPYAYDCSGLASAILGKLSGRGGGQGQRYFTTSTIGPGVAGLRPGRGTFTIGTTPGTGHMATNLAGLGAEARGTSAGILTGSAARSVTSFARQFYLPQVGGNFVNTGGFSFLDLARKLVKSLLGRITPGLGGIGGGSLGQLLRAIAGKLFDAGKDKLLGGVFDQGGWLMPGQAGVNRTNKPERVVGPTETMTVELSPASGRMVARYLKDEMLAAGVGATYLDSRRAEQLLAGAGLSNSRRR